MISNKENIINMMFFMSNLYKEKNIKDDDFLKIIKFIDRIFDYIELIFETNNFIDDMWKEINNNFLVLIKEDLWNIEEKIKNKK